MFFGTVTTSKGLLSTYPHVFITLKAVEVKTGEVKWIGRYPPMPDDMRTASTQKSGFTTERRPAFVVLIPLRTVGAANAG